MVQNLTCIIAGDRTSTGSLVLFCSCDPWRQEVHWWRQKNLDQCYFLAIIPRFQIPSAFCCELYWEKEKDCKRRWVKRSKVQVLELQPRRKKVVEVADVVHVRYYSYFSLSTGNTKINFFSWHFSFVNKIFILIWSARSDVLWAHSHGN